MNYKSIATQTERTPVQFIKIESYHTLQFDRYYYNTETETIFTIRKSKNGEIQKQIKPTTTTGDRVIIILRDIDNKPRTINYKTLIEYCKNSL